MSGDSEFTHTFEAEPGTMVDMYVENGILFLKRHGFGVLFGPLENEEHAQGIMDEFGWVLWEEPEPATEEKPDDG